MLLGHSFIHGMLSGFLFYFGFSMFLGTDRCRSRKVLPVSSVEVESSCDGDESFRTRMSTNRFPVEVRTRVDVGSLKASGIQRIDSRMEILGAIVVFVVVVVDVAVV